MTTSITAHPPRRNRRSRESTTPSMTSTTNTGTGSTSLTTSTNATVGTNSTVSLSSTHSTLPWTTGQARRLHRSHPSSTQSSLLPSRHPFPSIRSIRPTPYTWISPGLAAARIPTCHRRPSTLTRAGRVAVQGRLTCRQLPATTREHRPTTIRRHLVPATRRRVSSSLF